MYVGFCPPSPGLLWRNSTGRRGKRQVFGGKIGTAYQEEWRAVASADKPVPSPASFGQQWGLSSLHCSAAVAAAVMTALVSSPVCFGGGTVLNVLYVLWSAPPPLAEDTEDVEDVENAEDSGRRRTTPGHPAPAGRSHGTVFRARARFSRSIPARQQFRLASASAVPLRD